LARVGRSSKILPYPRRDFLRLKMGYIKKEYKKSLQTQVISKKVVVGLTVDGK